jgi:hypothetical protein
MTSLSQTSLHSNNGQDINMDISFEDYQAQSLVLKEAVDRTSAILQIFPRGNMGITPDDVRLSDEFRAAKHNYSVAFNALRVFNGSIPKEYMKRAAKIRRAERN